MAGAGKSERQAGREAWLDAAAVLRERAQVAWAVASALQAACADEPDDIVGVLEGIVGQAVGGVAAISGPGQKLAGAPRAEGRAPVKGQGAVGPAVRRTAAGADGFAAWRLLQQAGLAAVPLPAVWFATAGTEHERATVALGLVADGSKRVLGVWTGSAGEHRCSQRLAEELRVRGLAREARWLAVTEGERALDLALGQHWGEQLVLAHCQERVAAAVAAHLPSGQRDSAARGLSEAWACADAVRARRGMESLAESWHREHPGAARRLRAECEATTVTHALGLRGGLAERLRTVAPARYLLDRCLPPARGLSGREWLGAIALEAHLREQRFRRLPERTAVEALVRALAERAAAACG